MDFIEAKINFQQRFPNNSFLDKSKTTNNTTLLTTSVDDQNVTFNQIEEEKSSAGNITFGQIVQEDEESGMDRIGYQYFD